MMTNFRVMAKCEISKFDKMEDEIKDFAPKYVEFGAYTAVYQDGRCKEIPCARFDGEIVIPLDKFRTQERFDLLDRIVSNVTALSPTASYKEIMKYVETCVTNNKTLTCKKSPIRWCGNKVYYLKAYDFE